MRILLLGRGGQVGWELQRLLEPAAQLIAPPRDEADLAQPEALRAKVRQWRPEVIVNAAAYTAVDAAEKDEALARVINADAPRVLAQEAALAGALLVHYSTDYVFDGCKREPYREDDAVAPASAYGRTKLAGEEAIRASGCRHLILRTSWVYAPRGKNFVLTILRLARELSRPWAAPTDGELREQSRPWAAPTDGELRELSRPRAAPTGGELRVVADQVGSPTSARSLAEATVKALARRAEGTYHATGAGVTSWHGFAERIVAAGSRLGLCHEIPVRAITTADYPTPARRPAYSVLDNTRLQAELGIRLPTWEVALDQCLAGVQKL